MAEENKEVVEETTDQPVEQVTEEKVENKIDESKFESAGDDSVVKVDLSKPPEIKSEEVKEKPAEEEVVVVNEESKPEEVVEDNTPVLQEITEEEISEVEEEVEEAVAEAEATGQPLPENIQKLVDFMDETGGDIQDYVNLNRDISSMDDSEVLDEYYRTTKSHLSPEERNFLLEDTFGIDEEVDDEKAIRKKKIALKEQVAKAKSHLDGQKSKYYEEIKAGSKLTDEQQKAINFFNRYNKESEEQNKLTQATKKTFQQRTNKVFNDKFKGFDYQVGDKKFRFNVKDANKVKETQSDINNFVNKFVGEDKTNIEDAKGYHKSLFTAMNADAIANHFYEQGKADAIKGQVAKDKNINLNPRQTHGETPGGFKYKVLGETSSDFKFKIKNKKIKK
jgi:hypothetical protein